MDKDIKFFVGLDVHKDTIAVAVAEAGRAPARLVTNMAHEVGKLVKLLQRYGDPGEVQVVYEAGPTGYGLQRELARRSGVSPTTVNRMCANLTAQVSLETLDRLSDVLDVEPGEIIVRDAPRRRSKG